MPRGPYMPVSPPLLPVFAGMERGRILLRMGVIGP